MDDDGQKKPALLAAWRAWQLFPVAHFIRLTVLLSGSMHLTVLAFHHVSPVEWNEPFESNNYRGLCLCCLLHSAKCLSGK